MTYVEYATSAGPGTLIEHGVSMCDPRLVAWCNLPTVCVEYAFGSTQQVASLLTEQEAQAFYTMHGDSWVAV